MNGFDAVTYFSERSGVYEQQAFHGPGLAYVSELELAALSRVPVADKLVLDIGMGTGRVSRRLRVLGAQVIGLDGSLAMMAQARERDVRTLGVQGLLGQPMPFGDARFDGIVALRVFKYLQSWRLGLREITRVLRPGGWAVLEFANAHSLARFGYPGLSVRLISVDGAREELRRAGLRTLAIDAGVRLPYATWRWARTSVRARALAAVERATVNAAPLAGSRSFVITCHKDE